MQFSKQFYIALLIAAALPGALIAGRAPDVLASSEHRQTFDNVTARINCVCGCHKVVANCPHIPSSCAGTQIRRFIETRILEGMNEQAILDGMVRGFGERVRREPQLIALSISRPDLIEQFINGFGPTILHEEPDA